MIKNSGVKTMEPKDKILSVMSEAGKPLGAPEVVKLSGLEKSVADKVFKEL
jgi:predicted transcriptional regulator